MDRVNDIGQVGKWPPDSIFFHHKRRAEIIEYAHRRGDQRFLIAEAR